MITAVSMGIIFVLSPMLGAMTDRARRRMPFLVVSTLVCVFFTMLLAPRRLLLHGAVLHHREHRVSGRAAVLRRDAAGGEPRGQPREDQRHRRGRRLPRLVHRGRPRAERGLRVGRQAVPVHDDCRLLPALRAALLRVRQGARQPEPAAGLQPPPDARVHARHDPHRAVRPGIPGPGPLPRRPALLHRCDQHGDHDHGPLHGQRRREHRAHP